VQAIFGLKAIFAVLFMGPVDVVVTEYPPIFVLPASYLAAIKSRAKWIVHLSDAWVKAAVDLGYLRHPLLIKIAYGLERFFLRRADGFICVSEGSKEHFSDVLKSKTFSMIPNGVDTSLYCPKPELRSSVRERMGWANKCVGIYTGVIGNQQDFDVILNAAANAPENMHFVIVGGGSHSQLLHSAIAERGLRNVQLHQPLPEAELVEIMAGADYGISTLRPLEFCLGVHPVKLWSYMACELPVIATEFGESGALLKSLGLGLLVEPANSEDFLAAVTHLQADRDFAKKQGVSGREYVEQFRSRRTAAIQVLSLIKDLGISSDRHIEEKRS
jgi:glycosyltransferase involved in cell wall biosynthesis